MRRLSINSQRQPNKQSLINNFDTPKMVQSRSKSLRKKSIQVTCAKSSINIKQKNNQVFLQNKLNLQRTPSPVHRLKDKKQKYEETHSQLKKVNNIINMNPQQILSTKKLYNKQKVISVKPLLFLSQNYRQSLTTTNLSQTTEKSYRNSLWACDSPVNRLFNSNQNKKLVFQLE